MKQKNEFFLQGRKVTDQDIVLIKKLITDNPSWNRTRLSKEICRLWGWQRPDGQLKDMACRNLLLKLAQKECIQLPKSLHQNHSFRSHRHPLPIPPVLHSKALISCSIKQLYPIEVQVIEKGLDLKLFKFLISEYHYLGWSGTVGENLKYLIRDKHEQVLGCFMFGAAAWKVKPRDDYIGWNAQVRERKLSLIANNNRFLILPWVKVPHLASHILGKVQRRVNQDWEKKYQHPIYLLETFVEKGRFKGTSYKAANWLYVGETQGRGKLDVKNLYALPVKDIWVFPLDPSFRKKLCLN